MPELDIAPLLPILHSDTAEGYALFYNLILNWGLPNHGKEWIKDIYEHCKPGMGLVMEAFRGSTKTTIITNTYTLYQIGLYPRRRNLIIRAADDKGNESSGWIANNIEHNPAWKAIFPNVVPDKEAGWSFTGFEVKDTSVPYGEFRRGLSQNPSFAGYGYTSKSYHGNHPDGLLIIDDIDTEKNTRSDRERAEVRDIVIGTIMPMRIPKVTRTIVVGTPWREKDTLAYFKGLSSFHSCYMPVVRDGKPTWPEMFPEDVIQEKREESGSIEFARQYLLDVKAVEGQTLKRDWLHFWPVEKIDKSWPVVFGIDYASSTDKMKDRDRDYASIAIGRKVPGGGLVLVDGFRSNIMGQGELEQKLLSLALVYNPQIIGVEKLGKGEEFYAALTRQTHLPVLPTTVGQKSKGDRFEKIMAPHFEFNRVWVSDSQTSWLKAFENEWVSWPGGENDDCLDSVFHMMQVSMDALPNAMEHGNEYFKKKKQTSPWASLAEA